MMGCLLQVFLRLRCFLWRKHQLSFGGNDASDLREKNQDLLMGGWINWAKVLFHSAMNIACRRHAKAVEPLYLRDILWRSDTHNQRRCWFFINHKRVPDLHMTITIQLRLFF